MLMFISVFLLWNNNDNISVLFDWKKIYIYIYIYIDINEQTVSLYHNASVLQDIRYTSNWDRNPTDFTLVGKNNLPKSRRHSQRKWRKFF